MSRAFVARLLESYFRHRWLNLIPLFLMIAGAAAWFFLTKPEYTSRGTLYVQNGTLLSSLIADTPTQSGWAGPAKATTDDLNSLLQSDAFIRSVIAQSDLEPEMNKGARVADETVKKVRSAIWTQTLGQNVVLVGAAHTSPVVAQQLANGAIQNYIQWRVNNGSNEGATAQGYFEKLIPQYQADAQAARQDLEAYLAQHPDPVRGERPTEETFQIDRLQAAVEQATQRLSVTVSNAEKAKLAGDRSTIDAQQTYTVIDAPQAPPEPSTSRRKQALNIAVFILAGALFSLLAVVGATLLDTSLRFPADVQQKLGLPVLANIPDAQRRPNRGETQRARVDHLSPVMDAAPRVAAAAPAGDTAQGV